MPTPKRAFPTDVRTRPPQADTHDVARLWQIALAIIRKNESVAATWINRGLPRRLDVSLAVGLTVSALASPSYAQERGYQISRERAQAIHECSLLAARYPQYLWGNMEIYQYRACMTEHGQPE